MDTAGLAVFEARSLTTEPISQAGFFNGARVSHGTLSEMAAFLAQDGKAIPLMTMHNKQMLPIGRIFKASTFSMANGETELRSLFYIPADKASFAQDIEQALIDEVSVGVETQHAFCSECEFDYMGKDATIMNFLNMECANGHTVGEDGAHVRMVGLSAWKEQSLVARGAAKDAKILAYGKQKLASDNPTQLAANGISRSAFSVQANFSLDSEIKFKPKENKMPGIEIELAEKNSQLTAKLALADKSVTDLTASNTKLTADLAAAVAKVTTLEAAQSGDIKTLTAAKDKAEADLKTATDALKPHLEAAMVAGGLAQDKVPADFSAMLEMVTKTGLKLHQIVGAGSFKSDTTKTDAENNAAADKQRREAYKLS